MRVVQLLTQTDGGPVDHAVDVAIGLAARGIDSHVVGPSSSGTGRAKNAGVTWHSRITASKRDLGGAVEVAGLLHRLRADVVHLQDRRAGWLGRILGPALHDTRLVYTLHGVADGLSDLVAGNALAAPRRRRDALYYLHGERWVNRWGRCRVVSPSAAVARYAIERVRIPGDLVDIVPNGVDVLRFAPSAVHRPVDATQGVTVVWLGGLMPVKGIDVVLAAMARVPDVRLVLAGDGPLRSETERRIAVTGLADRVELLGHVEPASVLARADVYVLTSAAENCPMAMLQAMSVGVPVVATSVGGVPEIVRPGVDGLLCRPGSVSEVATALRTLARDPHRRREMGRSARQRVVAAYTLEHCVEGLLASYERARSCGS
ncbi:glycosyltransferase family 4 protein [soil metagenome]